MLPNFPDNGFPVAFPEPTMSIPPDAQPVETCNPFDPGVTPAVAKQSEPWYEQMDSGDENDSEDVSDVFAEL